MVFVSYTIKDKEYALILEDILSKKNIDILHFDSSIKPGDNIYDIITESINKCDVFIFIISKSLQESKWMDIELTLALSKSINENALIIPIVIDNATVPLYLENYLHLKINNKDDLLAKSKIIIDTIYAKKNVSGLNNEINYLIKESELLQQMKNIDYQEKKAINKINILIFSIAILVFILLMIFLSAISEISNILSGILAGLLGASISSFLSLIMSKIKQAKKDKKNG